MKRLVLAMLVLLSAYGLCVEPSFSASARTVLAEEKLLEPSCWLGGLMVDIGINGTDFEYVGNPNKLNRCDRVLFSFDIRRMLYAGHVKSAILEFDNEPMGRLDENDFELDIFKSGRADIRKEDIISGEVDSLCVYNFKRGQDRVLSLDITEQLNAALRIGEGALTFRLRDATIETRGNIYNDPEGIVLRRQTVKLIVKP